MEPQRRMKSSPSDHYHDLRSDLCPGRDEPDLQRHEGGTSLLRAVGTLYSREEGIEAHPPVGPLDQN
jgi:hypothetical protein